MGLCWGVERDVLVELETFDQPEGVKEDGLGLVWGRHW